MTALSELQESHERIEELLHRLEDTSERPVRARPDLEGTFDEVDAVLTRRMAWVERAFPEASAREKGDSRVLHEIREEHQRIRGMLRDLRLKPVNVPGWMDELHDLRRVFEHHVRDTERYALTHPGGTGTEPSSLGKAQPGADSHPTA